jgi:hypothetical protein
MPIQTVIPSQEAPPEQGKEGKLISYIRCHPDGIEAVIQNTGDDEVTIGKDIKVMINGLLTSSSECDKLVLAPGESTYCKDITGPISHKKGKVNKIQLNLLHDRAIEEIDCGK